MRTEPGLGTGPGAGVVRWLARVSIRALLILALGSGVYPPAHARTGAGDEGAGNGGRGASAQGSTPKPPKPMGDGPNLIMGTGQAREPQPFTREQRLLDAARKGDRAVVERALELGVSIEAADEMARSALLLAVRDAGDLELVRFLADRGAAIDRPDADGRTPLSFAASSGRLDLARFLVSRGAAIDRPDRRGRTPLFHAVLANQVEMVAYLIGLGADVNVRDRYADTPLMWACAKGHAELARLLLDHGADAAARDQEGRSASDRALPGLDVCREPGAR